MYAQAEAEQGQESSLLNELGADKSYGGYRGGYGGYRGGYGGYRGGYGGYRGGYGGYRG